VVVDPETRAIDLDSAAITENTRACYPIHFIPNHIPGGMGGHPAHILFLTCDAFGVMPPIARLTPAQAMYHFLSGYTAKVAGTERGVTTPKETFSACFGAPFLPLHPHAYAEMLGARIARHGVQCWLVNTGWTDGPAGTGHRISLSHTRAMVRAALSGRLDRVPTAPPPPASSTCSAPLTSPVGPSPSSRRPATAWTPPTPDTSSSPRCCMTSATTPSPTRSRRPGFRTTRRLPSATSTPGSWPWRCSASTWIAGVSSC